MLSPALNRNACEKLPVLCTIVEQLSQAQRTEDLAQWIFVRTLDGKTGYLNARDAMSPLMPRAQFSMRKGRWLLIALEDPYQAHYVEHVLTV